MENSQTQLVQKIDIDEIRKDFPVLHQTLYQDKPLVYLDSAATSQKPQMVIDALVEFYENDNANVHRGIHALAHRATLAYEGSREKIRSFINAESNEEVIFTTGTTDAINLVAQTWGRHFLKKNDVVLLSEMEHHSNMIPWLMLSEQTGCQVKYIPVTDSGELDLEEFEHLLNEKVKLVAVTHMSNVFGTINPVEWIIEKAHNNGSLVLLDGAQSAAHFKVDMKALNVDFYTFSGHKMMAPTGIGVLYTKKVILEKMPPFKGGGEMIKDVEYYSFTTASLPHKFEAGTPNIAGAIGFGTAIDYLNKIGMEAIYQHENDLTEYALKRLSEVRSIKIFGSPEKRGGVISFNIGDIHPLDLSQLLDQHGIAIRAGHHCAQPLMKKLGVSSTARASLYLYNTFAEIDKLIEAIDHSLKFF